jgi:hypothetical protein
MYNTIGGAAKDLLSICHEFSHHNFIAEQRGLPPVAIEELTARRLLEGTSILNDAFAAADEFLETILSKGTVISPPWQLATPSNTLLDSSAATDSIERYGAHFCSDFWG